MMRAEIIFITILVPGLYGFCYRTFGRIDKTATGRLIPVCEYNGLDILDGSSFSTAACMECVCADGVLACCGYGINGPKPDPPPGCKTITDGCDVLMVQIGNEHLDCYTGELITLSNNLLPDPFGLDFTANSIQQQGIGPTVLPSGPSKEPILSHNENFIAGITFSDTVKLPQQGVDTNPPAGGLPIDMNMLNTDPSQTLGEPSVQGNSVLDNMMIKPATGVMNSGGTDTNAVIAGSLSNTNGTVTDANVTLTSNTTVQSNTVMSSTPVILGVTKPRPLRPAVVQTTTNNLWDMLFNQLMRDPSLVDPTYGAGLPVSVPDRSGVSSNAILGTTGISTSRRRYTEPAFFTSSDPNTLGDLFLMSKFGDFGF